jgi:multisubunit Na+/H+ antiporter MnhE subunit
MSFELSKFQPCTIKQTCNMRIQEPQIHIVGHDQSAIITWFGTHIIVHGSKRSNFRKATLKFKIKLLVLTKDLTKQVVLVAKGILKLGDSQRKTLRG